MGLIGDILSSLIGKNRNASTNSILLQVIVTDPKDIQTIQMVSQAGEDTNPPPFSTAFLIPFGSSNLVCIGSDDGLTPDVEPGEKEFYGVASVVEDGKLVSRTKLVRLKFFKENTIDFKNEFETLSGLLGDTLTEMKNLTTTGTATNQAIDVASKARIDALQLRYDKLIGGF